MPSRSICLSFKRTQLSTNLTQQILGSQQICFGAFKTTLGFFFSLAMFEYT
jgi:hypothetical protein